MSEMIRASSIRSTRGPLSWLALVAFVVLASAAGLVGNLLQGEDVGERYLTFERPAWAPPQEAFGIVWPVLYVLIGIAAWRVWRAAGGFGAARGPLALWGLQLAINAIWPGVFFGAEAFELAIGVIVVLDVLVVATVVAFRRVDRAAGWLLVPYLLWLLYATALNVALWLMN